MLQPGKYTVLFLISMVKLIDTNLHYRRAIKCIRMALILVKKTTLTYISLDVHSCVVSVKRMEHTETRMQMSTPL
jgi:hypothetical protein